MPSISRRMSGSSSTIRMSYAIRHLHGQHQRSNCAGTIGPVVQRQPSVVVFHDLLDDGETQSSALWLVRYIGFSQPRTIVLWQANAVIGHDDANVVVVRLHTEANSTSRIAHRHRISGIL